LKRPPRPRELRKPFVASIVITDLISERQVSTRTSDLSVHGCFATTTNPFNAGVKVQIAIVHAGAKVVATGRVVSARADGMSIAFTKIEQRDEAVLEGWLSELRIREN
jgi:hypothetical protein